MAEFELTVNRVHNYGGISPINPVLSLVAFKVWTADQQWFANGVDRRNFLLIRNASGDKRFPLIKPRPPLQYGAEDSYPLWHRSGFTGWQTTPGISTLKDGFIMEIEDGEDKLFGPFDSRWFGATPLIGIGRNTGNGLFTGDATAASGVSVAAFYLPHVDELAGTSTATPTEADLAIPVAASVLVPADIVTPAGVTPSWVEHTSNNGWHTMLSNDGGGSRGTRRMMWIHNTYGESLVIAHSGGLYGRFSLVAYSVHSEMDFGVQIGWQTYWLDDDEHILIGPFDERLWAGSIVATPEAHWFRATGDQARAGLYAAAFELAV